MNGRLRRILGRIRQALWFRPLLASALSVVGVLAAQAADRTSLGRIVPEVTVDSIQALLAILASSVLVIASLAVATMVAAYASASRSASPRAFPLVVADDRSQNALSAFVATFIYSVVGLIASKNGYFGPAGRFVLFLLTLAVLAVVVLTFVTWIDRIARLGRVSETITQVERAASRALRARRAAPCLGGHRLRGHSPGVAVHAATVGYVQHIDMPELQQAAVAAKMHIEIIVLPGAFVTPQRALARCIPGDTTDLATVGDIVRKHFTIDRERSFEDDPRFGLVVLSEIAARALSPAVNDPGTAIHVLGVLVRVLSEYAGPAGVVPEQVVAHDRLSVPALDAEDLCDDAFVAIARDGAGMLEVQLRLLRSLETLATLGDESLRIAASRHAKRAVALSERAIHLPADRARIADFAAWR